MYTFQSGSGFGGGPNRSGNWGNGPRMSHIGIRQRQEGPGAYSKDNRVLNIIIMDFSMKLLG